MAYFSGDNTQIKRIYTVSHFKNNADNHSWYTANKNTNLSRDTSGRYSGSSNNKEAKLE